MKPNIILKKERRFRKKKITPFKTIIRTDKTQPNSDNRKIIVYDPKFKDILNYTRGIGNRKSKDYIPSSIEVFLDLFELASFSKGRYLPGEFKSYKYIKFTVDGIIYNDPKNRFFIQKVKRYKKPVYLNTLISYKLTINLKGNKKKTYFIKFAEGVNNSKQSVQEMILQKYLEKKGFNIIKPKFAYSYNGKKHFIIYDYISDIKNVAEAYKEGVLSYEMYNKIFDKLLSINLSFVYGDIKDILPKNCYYKVLPSGNYKLYLSDTFVFMKSSEFFEIAKMKGLVK